MAIILHVLLILHTWLAHPFHVSVCDIEFNQKSSSLEISQRIFLDDLEEALRKTSGWTNLDVMNPTDKKRFDALLKDYLLKNLEVLANGKKLTLTYLGHEIEADAMWCYIEVTQLNNLNSIEVTNGVLLETFDDQINIVHIKREGKIRSLKLHRDGESGVIQYQQ